MSRMRMAIVPLLLAAGIAATSAGPWRALPDRGMPVVPEAKALAIGVGAPTGSQAAYFRAIERRAGAPAGANAGSQAEYFRARERGACCR